MTLNALALAATLLPGTHSGFEVQASAYFPLTPGLKLTYTDTVQGGSRMEQVVGEQVTLGETLATPVSKFRNGHKVDEVFYKASGDEIQIIAYDSKHILPEPRTLFKVGPGKTQWTYQGTTLIVKENVPIDIKGESHSGGIRKILGKPVETLVVTLDATMGHPGVDAYYDKQEIIFAKGMGIVQLDETVTITNQKHARHMKLVDFEAGGGSH